MSALNDIDWTGERLLPSHDNPGNTSIEHLHRYAIAREYVRGKHILDIACGEGYGARLLSQVAATVVGVDISADVVSHANKKYGNGSSVRFEVGSCEDIPLPDASVDVVVSFETLEHCADHDRLMAEFKRVLRPNGLLIISTPDKLIHSDIGKLSNPYHIKELYRDQFEALLQSFFTHVYPLEQKVVNTSIVVPSAGADITAFTHYCGSFDHVEKTAGIRQPLYTMAIATDADVDVSLNVSLFQGSDMPTDLEKKLAEARAGRVARDSELSIAAIIPLYNGARWIEGAITSVLTQTLPIDELIVVDDGSTDDGAGAAVVERMVAERPLIRLLRKPNGGQSSARNFGISHSKSRLVAFLDQDDIWYPSHLEELIAPFRDPKNSRLGWVYSDFDEVDVNGCMVTKRLVGKLAEHPKQHLVRCLSENMLITPGCSLIRRSAFEAVGGFDERLCGYEDDDLFLRLFRAGYDNIFIDRPLSQWRIFNESSGHSRRMNLSAMIYMEKLLNTFPNDKLRGHHYARDMIGPRFFKIFLTVYRRAIYSSDKAQRREAVESLRKIVPLLHWTVRIPLRFVLPMMSWQAGGRILLAAKPAIRRAYRVIGA
jgi:glycosyltransferase involved in cell wall biosynthesis/SAM-dependent methyltransferase